jgi:hypothetical protein
MIRTRVLALCFLLAVSCPIRAQVLGGITGTVADSSGAVVPGAGVTIKNTDTNSEISVTTQANGTYLAPNLAIGNYSVTFAKDGFKTETHPSIKVEGGVTATVDGRLEVGSVAMRVEVTGTPMLNQVDTTVGYTLDSTAINNTPLATGSFTQLAILSPGVSADFLSTTGSNGGLGNQAIWSNGQRDTSNSFSINGLNNNNLFNGKSSSTEGSSRFISSTGASALSDGTTITSDTSVYSSIGNSMTTPAPETLEEMRVDTAMYDASQGGKSGAYISVITRSGTNAFHGQLYEHFQNSAMNSAAFFRNASTAIDEADKVPKLHNNRFGGTLGGPIVKNKLFFFGGYNRVIDHDAAAGSESSKVPVHLTDDRSAQGLSTVAQEDFGVTLAPSQIDPAALKILQFKLPNGQYLIPSSQITDPATEARLGYDVYLQAAAIFDNYQITANLDYDISSKDRLTEKVTYQNDPSTSPLSGSGTYGFPQVNEATAMTAVLENTTILSPSLTWEQKLGSVRMTSYEKTQQPTDPLNLGMNIFGSSLFPCLYITKSDYTSGGSLTIGPSANTANAGMYQNQFTGSTSLNWVHGRHTVSAGVNMDLNQLNIIDQITGVSELNFNLFTDFLQGTIEPSTYNRFFSGAANRYYRATLAGAFLEDKIRASRNLSVSLGLRFDYNGPFHEKYGNLDNFNPDSYQFNAANGTITNTGLEVAGNNKLLGTPGVSDSTMVARQWGLGPRIGIAWSPSRFPHIVIRTGFGMFYDRGEYFTYLSPPAGGGFNGPFGVALAPPFTQQVSLPENSAGLIIGNLDNPFAGASPPAPVTSLAALNAQVPNATQVQSGATTLLFGGYDPLNKLPYTDNRSFDVQWQPTNTLQMSLGYVGSNSFHQVSVMPFNQAGIATASSPINGQTLSYGFNVVPSVETQHDYDGGNDDMRAPYVGYSPMSVLYEANGIATYNALQFSLRKRLGHGLQVTGAYTWSHTLDESSGLGLFFNGNNPANLRSSYGTSTYDRPQNITIQYSYSIPKVASDHAFAGKLANGWTLNGLTVLQSGMPYNAYDYSGTVNGLFYGGHSGTPLDPILPLKPGVSVGQAELQGSTGYNINLPFVNSADFYIPTVAPGTDGVTTTCGTTCDTFETIYGATSRNTFRGPFQNRFDVALLKQTKLSERVTLRFQADAFNVFNHPSFDAPTTSSSLYSVSSAGVPTVRSFSTSFGYIQRTIGSPRIMQLNLSILF